MERRNGPLRSAVGAACLFSSDHVAVDSEGCEFKEGSTVLLAVEELGRLLVLS